MLFEECYDAGFLIAEVGEECLLYGFGTATGRGIPHHGFDKVGRRGDKGCLMVAYEAMATGRGSVVDTAWEGIAVAPVAACDIRCDEGSALGGRLDDDGGIGHAGYDAVALEEVLSLRLGEAGILGEQSATLGHLCSNAYDAGIDSFKIEGRMKTALYVGVGRADPAEIDRINILQATYLAMERAVAQLSVKPDLLLIDGNRAKDFGLPVTTVVKGDSLSANIAAASILAKVTRDMIMEEEAVRYPQYGFEIHKGYGTKAHYEALGTYGPSPIHRMTFLKKFYGEK